MIFKVARYWVMTATLSSALCLTGISTQAAEEKGLAYVSNQDGQISVIDLANFEVVKEIATGSKSPRGIGITPDGKLLVTANGEEGDISLISRETGELLKRIPIGKNPEFVRVRGDQAFVSFEPAAVGGPPPAPGSEEAKKLQKDREDDNAEPAKIAVIDLKQGKVIREITGGMETEGIEFAADGKRILVTNEADENVSVHDIASGKLVKKISTKEHGNRPRGIKVSPDGKTYVASLEYGNKLVIMDGKFKIIKSVPTGEVPYGLAFDRSGDRLFVALSKGAALQVFDTKTFKEIGRAPTGKRCWHFSFTPDDSHILAACGKSDEVVVIDANTLKVVKRIGDKHLPWGVVTYPKSVGSLDMPAN